jgi:flagellar basal body-associated protein FliL
MSEETPNSQEEKASSGGGKLIVMVFVGFVIIIETGMFFFLVPSAEEVSALAEARLIKSVEQGQAEAEHKAEDKNKVEEFDLGMFGETFSPRNTEKSFRVELRLFGLVLSKNRDRLESDFKAKQGRLQHAIRLNIRNSELEELQDNQLGLLERRILTTCNHLLDDDLLLGIGFNQYQLMEE